MTEITKEQFIDLIIDKIYYRIRDEYVKSLSRPLENKHFYNISLKWEDLVKAYQEKFNKEMPANPRALFRFDNCLFEDCIFDNIPFCEDVFMGCSFCSCRFVHCDMQDADITHSNLCKIRISYCDLKYAKIRKSDLFSSSIFNSNLDHAVFIQSSFLKFGFDKTDFTSAMWLQSQMKDNEFRDCILKCILIHLTSWKDTTCTGTTAWDNTSGIEELSIEGKPGDISPVKNHFISVNGIGSRLDNTYYDYENDRVICGCWAPPHSENDYYGGPLNDFEERVNKVYPEGRYHDEYMHAIKIFKFAREDYLKSLEA